MTPTNNLKAFPKLYASESDYVHKTFEDYLSAAEENYDKGFEPLQTLPASWYNSLLYLLTEQAQATKVLCDSIFAELQSVLTAGGVESSASYTNQLLTAIETITKLNTATASVLGGIKSSSNKWAIAVDPTTSIASVNTVDASTSAKGIVQLNDAIDSDSTTQAATANAVRKVIAAAKPGIATLDTTGVIKASDAEWCVDVSSSTGIASVNTGDASTSTKGIVQLNDEIDSNSTIQAATANAVRKVFNNIVFRVGCSTSAATAEKTVEEPAGFNPLGFPLIAVRFTQSNTAVNPTLKVGSRNAYPIVYRDNKKPAGIKYHTWNAGEVVLFCFKSNPIKGSYWYMLKDNTINLSGDTLYIEC